MNVLVTGGCGFIGSNFIDYLLNGKETPIKPSRVINVDNLTYAGRGKNLEFLGVVEGKSYHFYKGDIGNKDFMKDILKREKPDLVFNFAAESHVDRSIEGGEVFARSNVLGVTNLLEACLTHPPTRFVQISTDEVYGSIKEGSFSEEDQFNPTSPYAGSKAAAEHMVMAYYKTQGLPVVITRSANNYGPFQLPEKLIPLFITNLLDGKKVPLMSDENNPAQNVRDWLHVKDNCRAIWTVALKGWSGETYNIPGTTEATNYEITKTLLKHTGHDESMIERVPHRKAHDFRYSITGKKIADLGFKHEHTNLDAELESLVRWHEENESWWRPLKNE